MREKIRGIFRRSPVILATLLLISSISVFLYIPEIQYQLVLLTIPLGAALYLLSHTLPSSRTVEISRTVENRLHVLIFVIISVAGVFSPSSTWYSPTLYFSLIAIFGGLVISLLVLDGERYLLILLEILLVSILVRGAVFFQFPSIPGNDAPMNHVPAILTTLKQGSYITPRYSQGFPISHLRVVIGILISGLELKEGLYGSLFLPQSLSILFVYTFVKRVWCRNRAIVAAIFVATTSFNILYGFRRVPQATTVALLPIFLFSMFEDSKEFIVITVLIFGTIVLSHNAPPWIILFFIATLLATSKLFNRTYGKVPNKISRISILAITLTIIKIEYIWISDYTHNISRIYGFVLSIIGQYSGRELQTTSSTSGYEYALLRFSSTHLMMAVILTFIGLLYIELLTNYEKKAQRRDLYKVIWFCPIAILWLVAGYMLISNSPSSTKIFGPLSILTAPLLYDHVTGLMRGGQSKMRLALVVILIVSLVFVGVVHPRSTVDEFNRPNVNAIDEKELKTIAFLDQMPEGSTVVTYSPMHRYHWKTNINMALTDELGGKKMQIYKNNTPFTNNSIIYDNGESVVGEATAGK